MTLGFKADLCAKLEQLVKILREDGIISYAERTEFQRKADKVIVPTDFVVEFTVIDTTGLPVRVTMTTPVKETND